MADVLTGTAMIGVLTGTAVVGVFTNHIASGVAAVLGVNPRAVGSEHLRPGWCLHLPPWLVSSPTTFEP